MTHKIKRFLQKLGIKLVKMTNPIDYNTDTFNQYEMEAFFICKSLIKKPETVLLLSNQGKKYIKSDDSQIFIIIKEHQMNIINHQYSYNISLSGKAAKRIINLFDLELERRREEMESEIRSNIKHSLTSIYQSLKDENN